MNYGVYKSKLYFWNSFISVMGMGKQIIEYESESPNSKFYKFNHTKYG